MFLLLRKATYFKFTSLSVLQTSEKKFTFFLTENFKIHLIIVLPQDYFKMYFEVFSNVSLVRSVFCAALIVVPRAFF